MRAGGLIGTTVSGRVPQTYNTSCMKWLTKSDYLKYLIHPAYLWMAKNDKESLPEFDEVSQANVDQGNAVEEVARKLYPKAHLVDVPFFDGPDASLELMQPGGPEVIFQASVLTDDKLYARSDVVIRTDSGWDLYEVKGATKVKPEHLADLAFQRLLFMRLGKSINRIFVIHINSAYVRDAEIDPAKLFTTTEVTGEVLALEEATKVGVIEARKIIEQKVCPDDGPELSREWYYWRDTYRFLHPGIPADSILNMTRLNLPQIVELHKLGIKRLQDIPETFQLGPQQLAQVEVARSGQPRVNKQKIADELASLTYPLYFLDYETFASAIPLWDGVRPYQQLPFQYSLHVIDKPGDPLIHREFLARGTSYPLSDLLAHLKGDLGPGGSVIVWNKSFEMGCNDGMAVLHPEYKEFLADVNDRVYDLMEIFSNGYYAHPDFFGSASIKKVLPVLVPELSYKNLEIGEGMTSQIRWMKAARGEMSTEEAAQLYKNLITYCGQDTLAMVRIYEVLGKLPAAG